MKTAQTQFYPGPAPELNTEGASHCALASMHIIFTYAFVPSIGLSSVNLH